MTEKDHVSNTTENLYWRTLMSQDPASLCRRTLATFDPERKTYTLQVADRSYMIDLNARMIAPEGTTGGDSDDVGWDVRLLVLAYLTSATETPLVGRWVSPVEFSGGDLFFSSDAHNLQFVDLLHAFRSPTEFLRAGEKIGGRRETIGDTSFVLRTFPRIPILFIYWAGDEELPSKISVLVDESAARHLAIDGLWLAIRFTEKRLAQAMKSEDGRSSP